LSEESLSQVSSGADSGALAEPMQVAVLLKALAALSPEQLKTLLALSGQQNDFNKVRGRISYS